MDNYTLLQEVKHSEFKAFAQTQMKHKGFYQKVYNIALIVVSLLFIASAGYSVALMILKDTLFYVLQIILGLLASFSFLIVLHELFHAIAYKIKGANRLYFGFQPSKFLFYAASDNDKFTGKQFKFIALFPFTCITFLLLCLLTLFPQYFLFIFTILFIHHIFCGADFAVANYLQKHGANQMLTFDSKEKETTYFLKRV